MIDPWGGSARVERIGPRRVRNSGGPPRFEQHMPKKLALTILLAIGAVALPGGAGAVAADPERPRAIAKAECREDMPDASRREVRRCARKAVREARRGCRAERRADRPAFRAKYGERPRRACVRARLTA